MRIVLLTPKLLVNKVMMTLQIVFVWPTSTGSKCIADLAEKCTVNLSQCEKIHCRKVTKTLELNPALKTFYHSCENSFFSMAAQVWLSLLSILHFECYCSILSKYVETGISLFSWSFTLAVTAVTIMQILPKSFWAQMSRSGGYQKVKWQQFTSILLPFYLLIFPTPGHFSTK